MKPFDWLRGRHRGSDIWIVGSGASLNHVDPAFFDGKVTIGINQVYRRFKTTYLIRKDGHLFASEAVASGIPLIVSEYDCGNYANARNEIVDAFVFQHADNGDGQPPDLSVIGTEKIVVAFSTLGSAMHVAAEMGAANIILCGVDGGTLDGQFQFAGYAPTEADRGFYRRFIAETMEHTRTLRDALQKHYGCRIYSLNPFLGLTTDGHGFVPSTDGLACRHCGSTDTVPGEVNFHQCLRCGCASSELTYDDVRHLYAASVYQGHHKVDRAELLKQVSTNVEWLNAAETPEDSALDVGCLEGALMERLSADGWDCMGWDVDPTLASDKVIVGDDFRAADIGRQFGAVISRETIEHVPDHRRHFRELVTAVLPGGILQIQTPRPHGDYSDGIPYQTAHLTLLSPQAVTELFESAGMVVERVHLWKNGQLWHGRKPR